MPRFHHIFRPSSTIPRNTTYRFDTSTGALSYEVDYPELPILPATANFVASCTDGTVIAYALNLTTDDRLLVFRRFGQTYRLVPFVGDNTQVGAGTCVAFSPDGTYLFVGSSTTNVSLASRMYKYVDGQYVPTTTLTGEVNWYAGTAPTEVPGSNFVSASFSPDGNYLALSGASGNRVSIFRRDGDLFTRIYSESSSTSGPQGEAWSPDGRFIAYSRTTTPQHLFNRVGDLVTTANVLGAHPTQIRGVTWSAKLNAFITLTGNNVVTTLRPSMDQWVFEPHSLDVVPPGTFTLRGVTCSDDGEVLVFATSTVPRVYVYLWDEAEQLYKATATPNVDHGVVNNIVVSPAFYEGKASLYRDTLANLLAGEINKSGLKIALLDSTASFTAAHQTFDEVTDSGAKEVHGNNWNEGGVSLSGVVFETYGGLGNVRLKLNDVSRTVAGGSVTASAALIYDSTHPDKLAVCYIDFESERSAEQGMAFKFNFHPEGLILFRKVQ